MAMRVVADPGVQRFEDETVIHPGALFGTAFKMTGSQTEAEDLVQETFLRASGFYERFQQGANCKSWFFKIMTDNFINRYSRRKSEPEMVDYDGIGRLCAGGTCE